MASNILIASCYGSGYLGFDGTHISRTTVLPVPQTPMDPPIEGVADGNYYFGFTTYNGKYYMVVQPTFITVLDPSNMQTTQISVPNQYALKLNVHQLVVDSNILYITDTGNDRIITYDLVNHTWAAIEIAPGMADTKHVNALFFHDGKMYVMCHSGGPSEIRVFQNGSLVDTITGTGTCSHDMFYAQDEIWYCDSRAHRVASVSGKTLELRGFIRGAAQVGDKLYIGTTADRRGDCPNPGTVTGIYTIDAASMTILKFTQAEDECRSINQLVQPL